MRVIDLISCSRRISSPHIPVPFVLNNREDIYHFNPLNERYTYNCKKWHLLHVGGIQDLQIRHDKPTDPTTLGFYDRGAVIVPTDATGCA